VVVGFSFAFVDTHASDSSFSFSVAWSFLHLSGLAIGALNLSGYLSDVKNILQKNLLALIFHPHA
jgi:hypothetical protein